MKIEVKLELKISNSADFPTVMEYLKFWYGCTDSYSLKNLVDFNPYEDIKNDEMHNQAERHERDIHIRG